MQFSSTYHDSTINPFPASCAPATSTFPSSSSYPYTLPFLIDIPENHDFANNNTTSSLLDYEYPFVVPFIPTTHIHDAASFPEETTIANLAADCTAMLESSQDNNNANNINGCYGGGGVNATYGGISIPNFLTQKPAIAKKDRHSKIHTSQGLRDRRVRLSSEIARKFFDLQDMLEFDKPSNTLEWLFTKSENAIKELARSKHHSCSEKCSCHDSNNKSNMTGGGDGSAKGRSKLKWSTQRDQDAAASGVQSKKESRERARARARERTCYYKMCSNSTTAGSRVVQQQQQQDQLLEEIIRCPAAAPIQSTTEADEEANCERWRQLVQQPYPFGGELAAGHCRDHGSFNVIEESILIKRNMMSSSHNSHSHHQQNYLANIPKEASFIINNNNNNIDIDHYPLFPYSTPYWDANNGYYSNFCGIATMNLSTCFMNQCFFKLNFGNSWEERNNQSRHN